MSSRHVGAWVACALWVLAGSGCPSEDDGGEGSGGESDGSSSMPGGSGGSEEGGGGADDAGRGSTQTSGGEGGSDEAGAGEAGMGDAGRGEGGSGAGGAGAGGSEPTQSACDRVPLDKPVSEFTEEEAADNCLCGYESQAGDFDWVEFECIGRSVWSGASPADCEAMVAECVDAGVVCDGAEQLGFINGCTGTITELADCFQQAMQWQLSLTCADAGPDNDPARDANAPACLAELCNMQSGQ